MFRFIEIFSITPNAMKLMSIAVPPRLMNGNGIPVIGRSPTAMPMFSIKWNAK